MKAATDFYLEMYKQQVLRREFITKRAAYQRNLIVAYTALLAALWRYIYSYIDFVSIALFLLVLAAFFTSLRFMYQYHKVGVGTNQSKDANKGESKDIDRTRDKMPQDLEIWRAAELKFKRKYINPEVAERKFCDAVNKQYALCFDINKKLVDERAFKIEASIRCIGYSIMFSILTGGYVMSIDMLEKIRNENISISKLATMQKVDISYIKSVADGKGSGDGDIPDPGDAPKK